MAFQLVKAEVEKLMQERGPDAYEIAREAMQEVCRRDARLEGYFASVAREIVRCTNAKIGLGYCNPGPRPIN